MASISNDPNGRRRLQFTGADGRRRTIRLGKMPKRAAATVKVYVEHLVNAQVTKHPIDGETARWVASLDDVLSGKLANAGLIQPRTSALVGSFVEDYIAKRGATVASRTVLVWNLTNRNLVDYFGKDKPIRDITLGDGEDFRNHLLASGMAESTTRKRCSTASMMFRYAVKHRLIDSSPFDDVPKASMSTSDLAFIDAADAWKILKQLPNTQWRLLFALSRWGGLRIGSEPRQLRWADINWDEERFTVHAPKTKRYQGHESRIVPIFPELAPLLDERFTEAVDGDEYVLPMLIGRTDASLRKTLQRAIKRAGVEPWPRLWHNMRATRQTELEDHFPSHVVCAWLGNSKPVAAKHYLQVTDQHFEKAAQNPTQPVHDSGVSEGLAQQEAPQLSGNYVPDNAGQLLNICEVVREGLEPPTKGL